MTAPNYMYIKQIEGKGRSVIANRDFKINEIIEECEVIPMTQSEAMRCTGTILERYFYYFDGMYYIALGNGSLYNHSDYNNAEPFLTDKIILYATKEIKEGEEITICYDSLKFNNKFTG